MALMVSSVTMPISQLGMFLGPAAGVFHASHVKPKFLSNGDTACRDRRPFVGAGLGALLFSLGSAIGTTLQRRHAGRNIPHQRALRLGGSPRRPEKTALRASAAHWRSGRDVADKKRLNALQVLGLPSSASRRDIRSAYRKLARRMHPDVAGSSVQTDEAFRSVVAAYTVLEETNDDARTSELIREAFEQIRRERERRRVYWRAKLRAKLRGLLRGVPGESPQIMAAAVALYIMVTMPNGPFY